MEDKSADIWSYILSTEKLKVIFGYKKSVVNLWLNALGRQNSTQDSEVQGPNPDQNMLPPKKNILIKGALETE